MKWNWQLTDWPKFSYDPAKIAKKDKQFLIDVGSASAYIKTIDKNDYRQFVVEILSQEGIESSRIEGEILDRESLQSSIKKHFGLKGEHKKVAKKEIGMAAVLCDVYETYDLPLTSQMLCHWHSLLMSGSTHIDDLGKYRTHPEPMQIVSNRLGHKVFFEAPPSSQVADDMAAFIKWFNATQATDSILGRAAIAHLFFESIHPFTDGNGRIGRALVGKALSKWVGRPIIIAVSNVLEKRKKEYYAALERCNRSLKVDEWVGFFAEAIIQAQAQSMKLLYFLISKAKMLAALKDQLNARQEKAILRIFAEGIDGFKGGLSAENYIAITKAPRATATRDLADLVQKGALVKTGELRHTRYWLNLP